jgi:hypothetical protein
MHSSGEFQASKQWFETGFGIAQLRPTTCWQPPLKHAHPQSNAESRGHCSSVAVFAAANAAAAPAAVVSFRRL